MAGEASIAAATSDFDLSGRGRAAHLNLDVGRFGMAFAGAVNERPGQPIMIDDADRDSVERDASLRSQASDPAVEVGLHARVEEAERKRREIGALEMPALVRASNARRFRRRLP